MLIDTKVRNIERGGAEPGEQTKYHLDESGMVHVSRVLRNMYSKPIEAVVREYLANAVDAHVLAGRPINQIEIQLPTQEYAAFEIRDFGPGLDLQETKRLLFGFGASGEEKRGSNNYVGGFGVGCKSAFSITDQFFYTVFHHNCKVTWRCFLDETDAGRAELVADEPTDAPSGIEIKIPVSGEVIAGFTEAYGRVAWAIKDGPTVKRGARALKDWTVRFYEDAYDSAAKTKAWGSMSTYLDNPDFWRGKFLLNDQEIEWIWVPGGRFFQSLVGEHKRSTYGFYQGASSECQVWLSLGWQYYRVDMDAVQEDILMPSGTAARAFHDEFVEQKKEGIWLFRCPIGTVPLAPTRETLQYSTHCQKLLVGMFSALHADWMRIAKKKMADWSGQLKTIDDVDRLTITGLATQLDWVLKRTGTSTGSKLTKLASWKLQGYPVKCSALLKTRTDLEDSDDGSVKPWLVWGPHNTVAGTDKKAQQVAVYAKLRGKWYGNHADKTRESCSVAVLPSSSWPTDGVCSNKAETLFLTVAPTDLEDGVLNDNGLVRVLNFLFNQGASINAMLVRLGLAQAAAVEPPNIWRHVPRVRRYTNHHKMGAQIASVLLLYDTTPEEVAKDNPWVGGIHVIPYGQLKDAYKQAMKRKATVGSAGSGAPIVRAKPKPLDITRYHLRTSASTPADAEAMQNATSRVYVRGLRDNYYWPGRNYVPARVNQSAFADFAAVVDPGAYGILVHRTEKMQAPNPDRYGNWTPYQQWFEDVMSAYCTKLGLSLGQLQMQAHILVGASKLPIPCGMPPFVSEWHTLELARFLGAMESWYNWLKANVTSQWGQTTLEAWDAMFGWAKPEGWELWRTLEKARRIHSMADILAMTPALNDYVTDDRVRRLWATSSGVTKCQGFSGMDVMMLGDKAARQPWLGFNQLHEASELMAQEYGAVPFLVYPWEGQTDFHLWCRKSWLLFEQMWVPTHGCPAKLPVYPK